MKTIILAIIFASSLFLNCSRLDCCDSPPYQSTGKIMGYDMAMCACCGDYVIDIEGDAYDAYHYRFVSLPANSGIDLQTVSFPINVQFNWHLDPNSGCVRIIIDDIVLQN